MKKCSKCGIEKPESEFYFRNDTKRLRDQCKSCVSDNKRAYYESNKEDLLVKHRKYYSENKESVIACNKKYRVENREKYLATNIRYNREHKEQRDAYQKTYRATHKEEISIRHKKYYEGNREKTIARNVAYIRNKRIEDTNYRISDCLRARLYFAIRNNQKVGSAVSDLGCSIEELKIKLESKFRDGMTWENYGSVWEIDHIRPLSSFDLSDREQFLEACHYTNLQPLLIAENRSKGAKTDWNGV